MNYTLAPYDPAWAAAFDTEAKRVRNALGPELIALHHMGSTAIPGLTAKPVIDMLGEANALGTIDTATPAVVTLGYQAFGEKGITGRRFFLLRSAAGVRTHHLHVYAAGSPHIARHLAFRDYLQAHPEVAAAYAALKLRLVAGGIRDRATYQNAKAPFVREVELAALDWARSRGCRSADTPDGV